VEIIFSRIESRLTFPEKSSLNICNERIITTHIYQPVPSNMDSLLIIVDRLL
jgi:hypothetical protein